MQEKVQKCLRTGNFAPLNRDINQFLKRMKKRYERFLQRLSSSTLDGDYENTNTIVESSSRERKKTNPKRRGKNLSLDKVLGLA